MRWTLAFVGLPDLRDDREAQLLGTVVRDEPAVEPALQ